MSPSHILSVALVLLLAMLVAAPAAEKQNPSPMVEHTRPHERLPMTTPPGIREKLGPGILFIPETLDRAKPAPMLVFFHGGTWLPEAAASGASMMVLAVQANARTGTYASIAAGPNILAEWRSDAERIASVKVGSLCVGGWSAGCSAIRELLQDPAASSAIDAMICIDGIHTGYVGGAPGPLESALETDKLALWLPFARDAIASRKRMLITHTEIFPGTFASTTETANWLLRELRLPRRPVLAWGPRGAQQLSEARSGGLLVRSYAGNSAPDHVDLLHGLPEYLEWIREMPPEPPGRPTKPTEKGLPN